jgi:hypothetical protein
MPILTVGNVGGGVNKDQSVHELPPSIWTDALNIRFRNNSVTPVLGELQVMGTPQVVPYHVLPVLVAGVQHWLYAGANKIYDVTGTTHTNITRQTAGVDVNYNASRNGWTSTVLGGIPILNNPNDAPQQWLLTGKATALTNFPANTTCAVMRAFKGYLIALDVTKTATRYPYLVKWSTRADPGSVPASWDHTDATRDAGEFDLAEGYDYIIDGLALRDGFMIYKRSSVWRIEEIGGVFVFKSSKVLGTSGALNRNCIAEIDGQHFVLTNEDVVIHDGFQSQSILDEVARRELFEDIDPTYSDRAFVFKNPAYSEMLVCYPQIGQQLCTRALVWNWKTKAVSFRDIDDLNHAAAGPVSVSTSGATWATIVGTWANITRRWASAGTTLDTTRVLMASDNTKLLVADETLTFNGTAISSYVERRGLNLGDTQRRKLVTDVTPRISGVAGQTVLIYIGGSDEPYGDPTYQTALTYTIGTTVTVHGFAESRYPAIKFASGTSSSWKLDSFDIEYRFTGRH